MSDENGGDRSQKTVAELLALHGGSSDTSRRRRRRAAEEGEPPDTARDVSDTAPQAIIDRIKGEGAADTESAGADEPPARTAQQPVTQQPAGRQPAPQQPPAQPPQAAPPSRPQQQPAQQQSQPMARPWPPGGRRAPLRPQRPEPEPHTDRFPALDGESAGQNGHTSANPDVSASAPPAGLARWRQRRQQEQAEDTDIGVVPPVPAAATDTEADADGGPPTGAFTPSFDEEDEADYPDHDLYDDYPDEYPDDDQDNYPDFDYEDESADTAEDEDEYAEHDESEDGRSPARQWLVLAGQLALGVVGGAGVWLGFSWLWGQMPSAALIAALVATLGLVWVVRKVRRAEDTQTTVLALLVGLVVTVSPAALLLVSR